MQKEILLEILKQNQFTSHFSFDRVSEENASRRLNDKTASIGFIYRHIGETMNLFGQFLGILTDVINTTIGQTDNGQVFEVEYSRQLIPFFGTVTRIRLFVHALFHTSHHAGQISMTLAKGSK